MIPGHATLEGTERFKNRFAGKLDANHFRRKQNLYFSSIGIGSYLGDPDPKTDDLYASALKKSIELGVNVIDSAINYRAQRSERSFGRAIGELIHAGKLKRDEIIVCTKGGFLPFDGGYPENATDYIETTYIKPGILKPEDIAQGCHAMTPHYLEDQLNRSLKNLGLQTVDIYYLHNPETQLADVDRREFLSRIKTAFEFLEKHVKAGKIRMYGAATWTGFRVARGSDDYLSAEELAVIAREVGGPEHHFRAIQLPFNLAMPEAWIFPNQPFAANSVPFLGMIERLDMVTVASASLLQSRLAGPLPDYLEKYFPNLSHSSQRAIQFARSVPGITCALVGMKNISHVEENLMTAKFPPMVESDMFALFREQ